VKSSRTSRAGENRRSGRKAISVWILVLAFFFLAGSFIFLRSPFFAVKAYEVYGNQRVSKEEIISRMGQKGSNIFAFDLDKARKSIEASPWVEKALCERKLPGTIVVRVQERKPLAFVPVHDKIFLIDASGRILGEDDGSSPSLRAFTGVNEEVIPGQFLDSQKYGWGLRVLSSLEGISREKVNEVNVQDGDCTLILDDSCKVFLGKESGELERRLALLESILIDLDRNKEIAEYIDLRFQKPVLKLRSFGGR